MMKSNMDRSLGLIYSQQVMLALVEVGLTREEAYGLVQPKTKEAWSTQSTFMDLVLKDSAIGNKFTSERIRSCFDYNHHLKYVDVIFEHIVL